MDLAQQARSSENGGFNFNVEASNGDAKLAESHYDMVKRMTEWMNSILPYLDFPPEASEEDMKVWLLDGTILCQILNRLRPGSVQVGASSDVQSSKVRRFLAAIDKMGLPKFDVYDLEQGSMENVWACLEALRDKFSCIEVDDDSNQCHFQKKWNIGDLKLLRVQHDPAIPEGSHDDISSANIPNLMKWNNLDKAPLQLLFSVVDKVLDESFQRKSQDVLHRAECLLRKLLQEIEYRISTQADKINDQNALFKAREQKYQSHIRILETLVIGAAEENEVIMDMVQQMKLEKKKLEEKKKRDEQDVSTLIKQRDQRDAEIVALKQELDVVKMSNQKNRLELEKHAEETKCLLEKKLQNLEYLLEHSQDMVQELEERSESRIQCLKRKELQYRSFIDSQFGVLQGLRVDLDSVRREVLKSKRCYPKEFRHLGLELKELLDAAENYHIVLEENRKLYNEVQDLRGNIRVYCRIRPFLLGQDEKQTTIEHIGENGEILVVNPMKLGKDSRRLFKFNKVFAPTATQEEVFKDTQPLIRSVLDGYNVCIFAYGQTGSGKTYTMSGPDMTSKKDWGVNYRALHDLFQISQSRKSSILYEVGVQMVEIYNEQVRDLLTSDGPKKRLGIWSTTQPNGLVVPEASMHPVNSTSDVLELMNIGMMNRAIGATALNERSSRSHSILTVHVRGMELKSKSVLCGCLHLVDLAGSERVDRSEATGDRLREAQHINRSLSALGDVISALAQKSSHVPYRNSKLTQVLQSSLGGQAKTLMFVQLNPDLESYSETISTLKFAERVSGVELGAARSNKEGRDIRELMEQMASLKETIAKKDEEIERLRLAKVAANGQKHAIRSPRCEVSSRRRRSIGPTRPVIGLSGVKALRDKKAASDQDNCSEYSDRHSETGSLLSADGVEHCKRSFQLSDITAPKVNFNDDVDLLGFGDADSDERLSDISDSVLSMETETEGSISSIVEYTLFPDASKTAEAEKSSLPSKLPKPPPHKLVLSGSSKLPLGKASSKAMSSSQKVVVGNSSSTEPKSKSLKRWQ